MVFQDQLFVDAFQFAVAYSAGGLKDLVEVYLCIQLEFRESNVDVLLVLEYSDEDEDDGEVDEDLFGIAVAFFLFYLLLELEVLLLLF